MCLSLVDFVCLQLDYRRIFLLVYPEASLRSLVDVYLEDLFSGSHKPNKRSNSHISNFFFLFFFVFFGSALPAYIDIGQNIFLQCSCPLSSDCDVHANRPGKYFSGDSEVCNFWFLLARSTWHMADCTSVLISGYIICDPNGCRRPEVCAEGYVVAVVISATLLLELVLLNNLRGKVWAVLRWITHCYIILIAWSKSMPILWCAMFVSQPIAIAKLAFSKYARWLWQSLLFRLLPLSCQETTRVMWYGCPEELLRS